MGAVGRLLIGRWSCVPPSPLRSSPLTPSHFQVTLSTPPLPPGRSLCPQGSPQHHSWSFSRAMAGPLRLSRLLQSSKQPQRNRRPLICTSMVNVDVFSPSLLLGVFLVMSGVTLFGIRTTQPDITRDSDVFLSSMIIVTGGAIIFQGWRLDPLLLLCQLLTCTVAGCFALEALNLRKEQRFMSPPSERFSPPRQIEDDSFDEDAFFYDPDDLPSDTISSELPPPRPTADAFFERKADERRSDGWVVEDVDGYEEEGAWMDWESGSKRNDRPRKDRSREGGVLQTVEDWE